MDSRKVVCLVCTLLISSGSAWADNDAKAPFPFQEAPPKKDWEWDEDERFDELMEQLAINEASLDAVQAAIAKKSRKKASQTAAANRFDENNRTMDRKGGGPMKWDEFYGTNAERFFYHPIDPNTSYHTATALRQIGKYEDDKTESDIPSRQSLPAHQRPPQWDYIYRANRTASESALADAALLEGDVEQLEQRRTELEKQQAVLWCKLAFRAIQRVNIPRKPILRFELLPASEDTADAERATALTSASRFLACSLAVVEKAEQDQAAAFGGVAAVVSDAHDAFDDALLESPSLEPARTDRQCDLGKFWKLSQMLKDKAKTMSESYAGALDGDINKEASRKERFRSMLQDSVVDYAQILLALSELSDTMKTEWRVRVNTKQKIPPIAVAWPKDAGDESESRTVASPLDKVTSLAGDRPTAAQPVRADLKSLKRKFAASKVAYDEKSGVLSLGYDFRRPEQLQDFDTSQGKPEFQGNGAIRIKPLDRITHVGRFQTGTIQFQVVPVKNLRDVVRLGQASVAYRHSGRFRLSGKGEVDTRDIRDGRDTSLYALAIERRDDRAVLTVRANGSKEEVAVPIDSAEPFQVAFEGANDGVIVGNFVVTGRPAPDWWEQLMAE